MRAESDGMTHEQINEIRTRALTGLLMIRGLGNLLNEEFLTSKNSSLSEAENRSISGDLQQKFSPFQAALQKQFNQRAKTGMSDLLKFLEIRIGLKSDLSKDYMVARLQLEPNGGATLTQRKRTKQSQISTDNNSSWSGLKQSIEKFLRNLGLDDESRLFKEMTNDLIDQVNDQGISDPTPSQLAELTRVIIDDQNQRELPQRRKDMLKELGKSLSRLSASAEADKQSAKTEEANALSAANSSLTTALLDFVELQEIDLYSYTLINQRVYDDFTSKSQRVTQSEIATISMEILQQRVWEIDSSDELKSSKLRSIINELIGYT